LISPLKKRELREKTLTTSKTPLLDRNVTPKDLRQLNASQLKQVADELRHETIDAVSVTGGHLGAGLGVVELTVALHYVFDTPADRIIWDVGHQTYPSSRPYSHPAHGRRSFWLHQTRGKRI